PDSSSGGCGFRSSVMPVLSNVSFLNGTRIVVVVSAFPPAWAVSRYLPAGAVTGTLTCQVSGIVRPGATVQVLPMTWRRVSLSTDAAVSETSTVDALVLVYEPVTRYRPPGSQTSDVDSPVNCPPPVKNWISATLVNPPGGPTYRNHRYGTGSVTSWCQSVLGVHCTVARTWQPRSG